MIKFVISTLTVFRLCTVLYSHAAMWCLLSCTPPVPALGPSQWKAAAIFHCSSWCKTVQNYSHQKENSSISKIHLKRNRVIFNLVEQGCTTHGPRARSGPQTCFIWPSQQFQKRKKFLMNEGDFTIGAIHLWRPHGGGRGSGSGGRMWTGEGGVQPHVDVHTEN